MQTIAQSTKAVNPVTGETLAGDFHSATTEEVEVTMQLAQTAFKIYRNTSPGKKSRFP